MGGKSGGGGTNTVESSQQPPAAVMQQYQNIINQANNVASSPLNQYGGPMVAGFTNDQMQAFNTIDNSQGIANPYINNAQQLISNSQTPIWNSVQQYSPQSIQNYTSPYTQQVVNATTAQLQNMDAQQQQSIIGNAVSSGAWGGDRSAIAQSELANQQDLANNQTISGLYQSGFNNAQQEFNQQQGAQINAQQANNWLASQGAFGEANLGNEAQSTALQGAGAQLSAGNQQQTLAQSALNIPYEQFQQQQAYPYQNLSWLSQLSTGLGSGEGGTSSTTQPAPSTASQVAGGVLGAAGIVGGTGGFGSTGWLTTALAGLARGGVAKPREYACGGSTPRGFIPPHFDTGGDIPNIDLSYIPTSMNFSHGVGLPAPPKPTPANNNSAAQNIGLLSSLGMNKNKGNPSGFGQQDMQDDFNDLSDMQADENLGSDMELASMIGAKRGGFIPPHYDTGGSIAGMMSPISQSIYGNLSGLSDEQLREYGARTNSPVAQRILQQRQMMPQTQPQQQQPTQQTQGMARGGMPRGFDHGGDIPPSSSMSPADQAAAINAIYPPEDTAQPVTLIPQQMASNDGPPFSDNDNAPAPQGLAPAATPATAGMMTPRGLIPPSVYADIPQPNAAYADPINKPDPWLSLAKAGFAMAAGQSPNAMTNIGAGAEAGLNDYQKQKDEAAKESQEQGSLKQQGESLYQKLIDDRTSMWMKGEHDKVSEDQNQQLIDMDTKANSNNKQGYTGPTLSLGQDKTGDNNHPSPLDANGKPISNIPDDYFGLMAPSEIDNYKNLVKKNQPKQQDAQNAVLMSLVDQNTKISDLVHQIPIASSGDIHSLQDFVDRNKVPVFSDPERAKATVAAAYDNMGNVLDNIKTTFGGTGRVLKAEFDALTKELNANPNMSPEQKQAIVVGRIMPKLQQITQDQLQYTQDIRSGMAYMPSRFYQSPSEKRLSTMVQQQQATTQAPSAPTDYDVIHLMKNPGLAPQFDQKFGKGSSAQYIKSPFQQGWQ